MNESVNPEVVRIQAAQIPLALDFMNQVRREVFYRFESDLEPPDMLDFESYYLEPADASFFIATTPEDGIIGTLGLLRYDHRIELLQHQYDGQVIAEVTRCYVDPRFRRAGIGSMLFSKAASFIRQSEYKTLYLHTHRFLPGAVSFWERQGFAVLLDQQDTFQTVHMEKLTNRS